MSSKHSNLVNSVSELLFRAWFLFYDKNGKLYFMTKTGNFYVFYLHHFSRFYKTKTVTQHRERMLQDGALLCSTGIRKI